MFSITNKSKHKICDTVKGIGIWANQKYLAVFGGNNADLIVASNEGKENTMAYCFSK